MAKGLNLNEKRLLKNEISKYYIRGLSSRAIAKKIEEETPLKISHVTVCSIIKAIVEDMSEQYAGRIDSLFFYTLEKFNNLEAEMWEAWEQSKKQRKRTTSIRRGAPLKNGKEGKAITTVGVEDKEELQDGRGDPRYAAIILDCIDKRMAWLGKLKFGPEFQTEGEGTVVNNTANSLTLVINAPGTTPKAEQLQEIVQEAEQIDESGTA